MNNSTNQSLEKLLEELGTARKNFGYPVIVAFDRKTSNNVLKQEFIERYSGGLFIDPMNSEIDIEAGVSYHQLEDFCLDEPRLSFENADLSGSKAVLMMRAVRGKQIQLSQPIGSTRRRVTRLAEATPVNGPSLVYDIELNSLKGEVSQEGQVYFNLAAGKNYAFYGGSTQFELDKLGDHFKQYFEGYDETPGDRDIIEYTLGQIAHVQGSPLKPNKFAIRTHSASKNTIHSGDGAVVLFVELEGFNSENAAPPDENTKLPYLLPNGYSANVLVNTDFLALNIIAAQIEALPENRFQLKLKLENAEKLKYRAEGTIIFQEAPLHQPGSQLYINEVKWIAPEEHDANNGLTLEFINNRLTLNFTGHMQADVRVKPKDRDWIRGTVTLKWRMLTKYKVELAEVDGNRKMVLIDDSDHDVEFNLNYEWSREIEAAFDVFLISTEQVEKQYLSYFHGPFSTLRHTLTNLHLEVETFIMSSLLFRNSQIAIDSLHQPNDFITLGQLAEDLNKFSITPSENGEISVLANEKIFFKTKPYLQDVKWSVRHLPDYTGDDLKGEINENTGVYTAPAADKFKGSHIKVMVSAQKGTHISHVLVSVLRTTIHVYPSIASVNIGSYADIIAGEINGKDISMKVEGLGDFADSSKPDPLAQVTKTYVAPKQVPEWEEGMPKVDKVLRLDKVVVSSGTATNTVHILLPVAMDGPYWLKPKQGQAGVEFEFWRKPSGKPEEQVAKEETSWHVRVGNGTIDDGVYTPHPSKPDGEYIVIVAIHEDQIIDLYASMIVPIPFVSAEKFLALYASVEASDNSRRARINRK
ncbi:hypothetical protein C163_01780 [Pseudomonas sp. FGI182]|uniref:hypothetical protein n=1 Tax=Pseudomonas sp. FGI182 TaxID=1259844 RepID=UPI0003D84857|nr:hypothetical protein [Pseudomonas sp. FGI182]AHD17172.1 hypothetical protein C163_01780 [Pseudomonas sp. FGI182]